MKLNKLAASVAALSLVAVPSIAQATQSVAPVAQRIGASSDAKAQNLEGSTGIIVGVLAAAAVIAGIIIIADDDDDEPASP